MKRIDSEAFNNKTHEWRTQKTFLALSRTFLQKWRFSVLLGNFFLSTWKIRNSQFLGWTVCATDRTENFIHKPSGPFLKKVAPWVHALCQRHAQQRVLHHQRNACLLVRLFNNWFWQSALNAINATKHSLLNCLLILVESNWLSLVATLCRHRFRFFDIIPRELLLQNRQHCLFWHPVSQSNRVGFKAFKCMVYDWLAREKLVWA